MTASLETADKDFGQMMGFIMGYFQTQIAGAIANYSIADHPAKGPATADEIAKWEGINPQATFRLLRACASLGLVAYDGTRKRPKERKHTNRRCTQIYGDKICSHIANDAKRLMILLPTLALGETYFC